MLLLDRQDLELWQWLVLVLVLMLDVALWLIVGLDMGILSASLKPVVGYILYASGWVGIYLVAAIVNNHIFDHPVLPTFGTLLK